MLTADLEYWWKLFKKVALITGVFLSFLGLIEILHAFSVLKDIHSALGYLFLFSLTGLFVYFILKIILPIYKRPKALTPPIIVDKKSPTEAEYKKYLFYLTKYLERLSQNPNLPDLEVEINQNKIGQIRSALNTELSLDELLPQIDQLEKEFIGPILEELDSYAKTEVEKSIQDVMIGVTLSPYRAADLIIVFYRNISMVSKVVSIYHNRPLLIEQLKILRDILKVVATVNYLNFGTKLTEQFLVKAPLVGRLAEDFAQGIGAGLMTSAAGHSTIYRCRSYQSWDQEEAIKKLSSHIRQYLVDVGSIFKKTVLPKSKEKIYSSADPEEKKDPQFWQKITDGFSSAIDASGTIVSLTIKKPVAVGTKSVIYVGSFTFTGIKTVSAKMKDGIFSGFSKIAKPFQKLKSKSYRIRQKKRK